METVKKGLGLSCIPLQYSSAVTFPRPYCEQNSCARQNQLSCVPGSILARYTITAVLITQQAVDFKKESVMLEASLEIMLY